MACHATFDESGSFAQMNLNRLELQRLEKQQCLDLIQPSQQAKVIPDLAFYAEPVIEDTSEYDREIRQLDAFIDEFYLDGHVDKSGELPDVACYIGRHGSNNGTPLQGRIGSKPQVLTMCGADQLSEKQNDAEVLVAAEDIASKTKNSKINNMATRVSPRPTMER